MLPRRTYAFLDSGVGGLPYLAELAREEPYSRRVYLADNKNFPYGEKSREQIIGFITKNVDFLLRSFSPDVIILACNTMSVTALDFLRSEYGVPFVGTVPPIKAAAAYSKKRRVGILASDQTLKNPYTKRLIDEFAADCFVLSVSGKTLIDFIENDFFRASRKQICEAAAPFAQEFRKADTDALALACTHFLHISGDIAKLCAPDIAVFDSLEGVIRQARRITEKAPYKEPVKESVSGRSDNLLFATGSAAPYDALAERFGLTWAGAPS